MCPITFEPDAPAAESTASLLAWFKDWLAESSKVNGRVKWKGIHDEGTYLTAWREYQLHAADPAVNSYAMNMLGKADAWLKRHLVHGYWRKQEVHHGVEHFIIFLAWIHELDPAEPVHARQLRDAAANITDTWSKKLKWYDPATNRFTSLYLGTRYVDPSKSLNIAEHLRLVRLAWLGLACGGNPGLAGFIKAYSHEWASQVASGDEIPLYLGEFTEPDASQRARNQAEFAKDAQSFVGAAPKQITPRTRAEIHVANGTPGLFMALHAATRDLVYLDAAERVVVTVLGQLGSPYAHPVGDLAWQLHRAGRLPGLAATLEPVKARLDAIEGHALAIKIVRGIRWHDTPYFNTVGMRKDMPAIEVTCQDSGERVEMPSPATLGLLYRITGKPGYLRLALDYTRVILENAKPSYPEDREHGCGAAALHAFCIGHGRNWGAGFASTALRAALGGNAGEIALPAITL